MSQPAIALAALLIELLVVWGASPWAATDLTVLTLVVLALAAAAGVAAGSVALVPAVVVARPVRGHHGAPLRRGRPTDPTHHPLAPRAPGPA